MKVKHVLSFCCGIILALNSHVYGESFKEDAHSNQPQEIINKCPHKHHHSHSHKEICQRGQRGRRGPIGPMGPPGTNGQNFNNYVSAFNENITSLTPPENLIFDTPLAINGISYNGATGVFTINTSGVYSISIGSVTNMQDGATFSLLINNSPIGPNDFSLPPGNISIILDLQAGNTIALQYTSAIILQIPMISISINQIGT
ncbi:MAG: hypothetical protein Q8K60_03660 [Parachlamydiaceae bacterium]|nr:hypothetical protein [Parachlamydiaceae bacterium]